MPCYLKIHGINYQVLKWCTLTLYVKKVTCYSKMAINKKKKKETIEQQISKLKDPHWKIDIDRYGFSHQTLKKIAYQMYLVWLSCLFILINQSVLVDCSPLAGVISIFLCLLISFCSSPMFCTVCLGPLFLVCYKQWESKSNCLCVLLGYVSSEQWSPVQIFLSQCEF